MRGRLAVICHHNQVRSSHVLSDTWFCAADNMNLGIAQIILQMTFVPQMGEKNLGLIYLHDLH